MRRIWWRRGYAGEPEEISVESGSSNGDEDEAGEDEEDGHHHLVVAPRSAGRVSLSEMSEAARARRRDVIESTKASAERSRAAPGSAVMSRAGCSPTASR
jgi:hypothetical protein